MNQIILTTESCSDIPAEVLQKYQIYTVPYSLNFPDRTVFDGDIPVQEIYDFYEKTKQIPKTNAVSPYQYTEFFERIAKENPGSEIIHIGYSSACSCSFQNAVIGVRDCNGAVVHLVDSLNVSGGLGNIALKAYQIVKENPEDSAEELVEKIKPYVKKTKCSFVPNTLDFLLAGGRVSNAAAIGASILKLKPRIDIIKGELIASKKYRGDMSKVALKFAKDFMENPNLDKKQMYIFYSLGADEKAIDVLWNYAKTQGFEEISVSMLGCVMTVHGGKGAIGLSATERI